MSFRFLSLALLIAAPFAEEDQHWMKNREWGSKHGTMNICGSTHRMTGVCVSGRNPQCDNGRYTDKVRCTGFEDTTGQSSKRWSIAKDHRDYAECNIEEGYSAVGSCTSGGGKDCGCSGGESEGCTDTDWVASLLRCAKGSEIIPSDTLYVSQPRLGTSIACPVGYIVYKMCASGRELDCRSEKGAKVAVTLGCVRSASAGSGDPGRKISVVSGYWKDLGTYNEEMTYTVQEGVETSMGHSMSASQRASFGFSQEVTAGVGYDFAVVSGSVEVTAGFSQDYSSSVTSTIETMLTKSKFESWTLPCGGKGTGFETIYQWILRTQAEDGKSGPVFSTRHFLCVEGTPRSPSRPRCAPDFCENEHKCNVCTYDWCDIHAVGPDAEGENASFHFDSECVDRKLERSDWGEDEVATETYMVEHSRGTIILDINEANLYRFRHANATNGTEGDSFGTWSGVERSEFKAGDRFRVLTFELESAAWMASPVSLAAVAIALLSALLTTN